MEYITNEIISIFNFLLPGFIVSFIMYGLTDYPKKSEFESIIIALIFTIFINAVVEVYKIILFTIGKHISIGKWYEIYSVIWSFIFALLIGMSMAYILNNDIGHKLLRKYKITKQTSYPTEWYGTFSETPTYIVLHLRDGRRIMGWPLEWPSSSKEGHFVLQDADWLLEEKNENIVVPLANVDKIMVEATNVEIVELMKVTKEELNESKESTAAGKTNKQ